MLPDYQRQTAERDWCPVSFGGGRRSLWWSIALVAELMPNVKRCWVVNYAASETLHKAGHIPAIICREDRIIMGCQYDVTGASIGWGLLWAGWILRCLFIAESFHPGHHIFWKEAQHFQSQGMVKKGLNDMLSCSAATIKSDTSY